MVFQWLYCDDDSIKIDENDRSEWFYNILERNLVLYLMTWVTFHLHYPCWVISAEINNLGCVI